MVRKQIRFYGDVQGVGFRYISSREARSIGLTGWVRNEFDGTVLMEVQGTEAQIDMLVVALLKDRYICIRDMDVKTMPLCQLEKSFGIVGY